MSDDDQEDAQIDDRHEPIDPKSVLGAEVASQMEAIENDFGDDYEIGAIVTIVEVRRPDGAGVRVRCNAPNWVGLGLLKMAEKALEARDG